MVVNPGIVGSLPFLSIFPYSVSPLNVCSLPSAGGGRLAHLNITIFDADEA
jgi:hypothetical protein